MQPATRADSQADTPLAPRTDRRAVKIFARTLFKDMVENGLSHDQIIALATQLHAHVTDDIKESRPAGTA